MTSLDWVPGSMAGALVWLVVGCGPAPGGDGAFEPDSEGASEGSSGALDSTTGDGRELGPPNVMPPGHLVDAPMELIGGMTAIADYDDDGAPEVLVIERVSPYDFSRRYQRYGLNADETALTAMGSVYSDFDHDAPIYAGDVDLDGRIDAVRVEMAYEIGTSGLVPLFGGVAESSLIPVPGAWLGGASDFDADGRVEFSWSVDDRVRLYEVDDEAGFSVVEVLPTDCEPRKVMFGDVDGDDDDDAVVLEACGEVGMARIHVQEGGTLSAGPSVGLPCGQASACLADIDSDGISDLLTVCRGIGLSIHRGVETGGFDAPRLFADEPETFSELRCADFDGDGAFEAIVEAAAFDPSSEVDYVMPTLVAGTLAFADVAGFDWLFAAGGDLDGDGCDDLAVLEGGAMKAWISDCE